MHFNGKYRDCFILPWTKGSVHLVSELTNAKSHFAFLPTSLIVQLCRIFLSLSLSYSLSLSLSLSLSISFSLSGNKPAYYILMYSRLSSDLNCLSFIRSLIHSFIHGGGKS